jgi:hypothetical protein
MPIPFETVSNDLRSSFYGRARWYLKTSWIPQRCDQSGQWLWLCKAYQGEATWTGPGDPIIETRWLSRAEFTRFALTGQIG